MVNNVKNGDTKAGGTISTMPGVLSIAEVAPLLGYGKRRANQLIADGKFPVRWFLDTQGQRKVLRVDLERYLATAQPQNEEATA